MAKKITKDMTVGSTARQIFLFAIPFLIGNLFQQFYNIADMVIVGRTMNPLAYAAVGSTSSLVWFASGAIQALTVGFSVVTAHHFGAKNEENIKKSFASAIGLSAVISIAVSVVCVLLARPMLEILRTPANLVDDAYNYIVWIFAGLIATALFNLLSNMIRALGDSRTPLYFLIIACVINIILDIVFIKFCNMGTAGAGVATVVAQLVSGILCIVYIVKKHPMLHIKAKHFKHDFEMAKSLLKIGIPMAFLNMVLSVGAIVVQFVTNGFGDVYVSSQVTGSKIETFVTQPLLSFGSAVSVFAAQNYGAKKYSRVLDGSRKTILMSYAWSIIAALILLPAGKLIIRLIAGDVDDTVVNNAYMYILINTALTFILSPLIIYKNVLQAVGKTTWTMISGFTEIVGRAGMAMLVILFVSKGLVSEAGGFVIICLANPTAWLFGLLTVLVDYILLKKKFKRLISAQKDESPDGSFTVAEAKEEN
ncbi:MAG: MATE family efflux transporter [Ruminococcaceae bacterium]|nr:MATE family efflux transporter [Oscillospiraceae bacterium]